MPNFGQRYPRQQILICRRIKIGMVKAPRLQIRLQDRARQRNATAYIGCLKLNEINDLGDKCLISLGVERAK